MMLKELLETIQETAVNAAGPQPFLTGDPRRLAYALDGKAFDRVIPPPVRSHAVNTLADLIAYAQRTQEIGACSAEDDSGPVVWHDHGQVVLVLDDDDRRDTVTLDLTYSRPWSQLAALGDTREMLTQEELIRLLRVELGLDNAGVLGQFRKLDWRTGAGESVDIQASKQSLGRTIEAAVQGVEKLPDKVSVLVPIYETAGETASYAVDLIVEVDARNQRFLLVPTPGMLRGRLDQHQADIHARLSTLDCPVYFGRA